LKAVNILDSLKHGKALTVSLVYEVPLCGHWSSELIHVSFIKIYREDYNSNFNEELSLQR
jgi:hypothetical protein